MDLAYVEKLAKYENGVWYLFDRTVDEQGMKRLEAFQPWNFGLKGAQDVLESAKKTR